MRLRKSFLTAGVCLLAVLSIIEFAPKTVHAAVAALVQVVNTTANPAIVSAMDDPGRVAYQANIVGLTGTNCNAFGCSMSFAPVPAGHRLVLQHVSAFIQAVPNSVPMRAEMANFQGIGSSFFATVQNNVTIQFDQPILVYFDAGETPIFNTGFINGGIDTTQPNSTQVVTASGYMLDCTAAPCSPIVRH